MTVSNLNVAELDFNKIKDSFKTFLKAQDKFRDYDFEGSNIAVLLDLLAYNTHLNAFYTNFAISEEFLDSAQLDDSVISHTKELNYLPRSATSSRALVDIEIFPQDAPDSIIIPKETTFTTRVDDRIFVFSTAENIIVRNIGGRYLASNTSIYEGQYISEFFTVDSSNTSQRFVISNKNIDIKSMKVSVQTSSTDTNEKEYLFAPSLLGYDKNSEIYFLQGAEQRKYELLFGNDIIGKKLINGNVVKVNYRLCSGSAPNNYSSNNLLQIFKASSSISGYSNVLVTTLQGSMGGDEAESIASIKFNAPRAYQTQERAVTTSDYEILLKSKFPEIQALSVYGGEELDPPRYGKVVIAVDLKNSEGLPNLNKEIYANFVKERNPISIVPLIVQPEFLFVELSSNIKFNVNLTTKNQNDIFSLVLAGIKLYDEEQLNKFNSTLIYSKFVSYIDSLDSSIIGNESNLRIYAKIVPDIESTNSFFVEFLNPLKRDSLLSSQYSYYYPAITSSTFVYNNTTCFFEDDGNGNIDIVTSPNNDRIVVKTAIGSIDYESGKLLISNFSPSNYDGDSIRIFGTPFNKNISSRKNKILLIGEDTIALTISPVRE